MLAVRFTTIALLAILLLAVVPDSYRAANGENDGGTVPLLVKSRVPLTSEIAAAIGSHAVRVTYVWPEIDTMALTATPSSIAALASDPLVALIEADGQGQVPGPNPEGDEAGSGSRTMIPELASSAPIQTWNLDMVDVAGTGYDGTGVTVAVLDSGLPQNWEEFLPPGSVDTEHAAGFSSQGWGDFHNPIHEIRGVGGHLGLQTHGLAVSSVIVGFPSEFGPIGGAAPGAKILPVRVVSQFNWGWFSWFTAGILHVARLKDEGQLPGPVVINFSIWLARESATINSAIDYAIGKGVLFVTVAGNFGPAPGSISPPGTLPQAITAGAVGWTQQGCSPPACTFPWFFADVPENDALQVYVAPFSGRESAPPPSPTAIDVLAPGSLVFGEWLIGPGYSEGREVAFDPVANFIFGTSFASPHVAGIVAQMLEKNPGLTQSQAEEILRATALPILPDLDGVPTPFGFILPWGTNATGSGLARGMAAVAATPAP